MLVSRQMPPCTHLIGLVNGEAVITMPHQYYKDRTSAQTSKVHLRKEEILLHCSYQSHYIQYMSSGELFTK